MTELARRHRLTTYAATHVSLAEALGLELVTCDGKLAGGGHRAEVLLLRRGT